ncbi:MAG: ribulose-phosphate 3-epimerase [Acidobacteriota bacterium]
MPWIAPSILSANFTNLEEDIHKMEQAGAEILHIDVMDGHFVPNLTIGIPVLKAIRKTTGLLLDVHLMISNPEEMAEAFVEAGADFISVHYETVTHLDRLLERIREKGARPGVAVNPHTPVLLLEEILHKCHHVLVLSVNPGLAGQEFIAGSFEKMRKLRAEIQKQRLDVKIEIDGGIGPGNVGEAVRSGADILVAGSAVFSSENPQDTFRQMQVLAEESEPNRAATTQRPTGERPDKIRAATVHPAREAPGTRRPQRPLQNKEA